MEESASLSHLLLWLDMALLVSSVSFSHGLQLGFYNQSCPQAEAIVAGGVLASAAFDIHMPPKLLRLLFHDCFIEGCDGSVLLDSGPASGGDPEKKDPSNLTLGGFEVIDSIKRVLEQVCPGVVSCSDIVALAARDAVTQMGGPRVRIPTGRLDGFLSDSSKVRTNLPDTPLSVEQLQEFFAAKGLSEVDMVTLSGAHTVGQAHCKAFNDRFEVGPNMTVEVTDGLMDPGLAQQLIQQCPIADPDPATVVPNDPITPTTFDNVYYANVQRGRGLFHSDATLMSRASSAALIVEFMQNQPRFFMQWKESFINLTSIGVKSGSEGEIRRLCRQVNNF